jgi:SAM-dependent methyltransferase
VNYAEQSRFLARYRVTAAALLATVAAAFAWSALAEAAFASIRATAVACLLAAALMYGLWYLPLYLRLSIETRKRYSWSLRARYVLIAVLALVAIPATRVTRAGGVAVLLDSARPWLVWIGAIAIGAASVAVTRRYIRRNRDVVELPLAPALLIAGDLAVVMLVAGERPASPLALATGLALAAAIYALTSSGNWQWAGVAGVALADVLAWFDAARARGAMPSVGVVVLPLAAAAAAVVLARIADRQHALNLSHTVDELSTFALVTPEYATEMLATSTGILARNWNDARPVGHDAVAQWYEENSEYYLYDLAQFHLAYKHIAFMRDVVALARGRVLDFGAGIGDLALELARLGHDTVYVDVDGRTKAFARWRAERDWIPLVFASDLDEVDGLFDTIVSLDVFEHLAEPVPVIDALVDRLAPGGRMIVTAYFGATKAHPMHFDHQLDLARHLSDCGLVDAKTFAMRRLRSEVLRKRGVLVFEKR